MGCKETGSGDLDTLSREGERKTATDSPWGRCTVVRQHKLKVWNSRPE